MEDHHSQPYTAPMPPPPPNPLAAPASPAVDRASLRDLARRQRAAIVAGCANALGGIIVFSHVIPDPTASLVSLIVAGFIIVAVFRLAQTLHGVGIAILAGIAMLIPIVWIVVLLVLSSKASKQLRAAGIHVGFFGADPSSI